jgi:hypothetical protein
VEPIEAKLLELSARDGTKPNAVVSFVLGAFGELSNSCCSLCTTIARANKACAVGFWKMPPKGALALCKQKILRFWGLTAQRGRARVILGRFKISPLCDPTAATREPDPISHKHHTFIFPSLGAVPLTLLASAGGAAAASKRPCLLLGSPLCR